MKAVRVLERERRRRAGTYARAGYERGLRAYRRRIRWPLLIVAVPMQVFALVVLFWRGLEWWSFFAGALGASAAALVSVMRDDAPQHVLNWKRGADGERQTAKALRALERRGWSVEHDLPRNGRANVDHIVRGPRKTFLLETKNLTGTIEFNDGVLCARQWDDPDEVYRYHSLARRVRGQARELSAQIRADTGRRIWVDGVVVVWGDFPTGFVQHEDVTYIRARPTAAVAAGARQLDEAAARRQWRTHRAEARPRPTRRAARAATDALDVRPAPRG